MRDQGDDADVDEDREEYLRELGEEYERLHRLARTLVRTQDGERWIDVLRALVEIERRDIEADQLAIAQRLMPPDEDDGGDDEDDGDDKEPPKGPSPARRPRREFSLVSTPAGPPDGDPLNL